MRRYSFLVLGWTDEHERKLKIYKFWTVYSVCAKRWELEPQISALKRVWCSLWWILFEDWFAILPPRWGRGLQRESERSRSIAGGGRPVRPTTWAETPSKTSRGSWTASWFEKSVYKNTSVHHSGLSTPNLTVTAVVHCRSAWKMMQLEKNLSRHFIFWAAVNKLETTTQYILIFFISKWNILPLETPLNQTLNNLNGPIFNT